MKPDFSNLQPMQTPRERITGWIEGAAVWLGFAGLGWFMGSSVLTLLRHGGGIAAATLAGCVTAVFLWFWWSAWSRRIKLVLTVFTILVAAVPVAAQYAGIP